MNAKVRRDMHLGRKIQDKLGDRRERDRISVRGKRVRKRLIRNCREEMDRAFESSGPRDPNSDDEGDGGAPTAGN